MSGINTFATIVLRNNTAASLSTDNRLILQGEMVLDRTSRRLKVPIANQNYNDVVFADDFFVIKWANLTGVPSTFTPESHTHAQSEITGLVTSLSGKADTSHTHTAIQISDSTATGRSILTAATADDARTAIGLATIAASGSAGDLSTGSIPDARVPASAVTQHEAAVTIAWSQLTGVPGTFTPAAHNQAWSTITASPTTLSGYGITDALLANTVAVPMSGQCLQRVTVTDARAVAGSQPSVSVRRPNTADNQDIGYVYSALVLSVSTGSFDVQVSCVDPGGMDCSQLAPNETVTLVYTF